MYKRKEQKCSFSQLIVIYLGKLLSTRNNGNNPSAVRVTPASRLIDFDVCVVGTILIPAYSECIVQK